MKNGETKNMDLSGQNVVAMRDAKNALAAGATQLRIGERCVVTPSARDFLRQHDIELVPGGAAAAAPAAPIRSTGEAAVEPPMKKTQSSANPRLFNTPEAEAVKLEICAVGRKLWDRSYVDGNGGNISYRIGPNEVICTPTLVSKHDLTPDDLCLVDLDGMIGGTGRCEADPLKSLDLDAHKEAIQPADEYKSFRHEGKCLSVPWAEFTSKRRTALTLAANSSLLQEADRLPKQRCDR